MTSEVKLIAPIPSQELAVPTAEKPLTLEERAKLHEKLRARMSQSRLSVVAPLGWTAYWARKEDDSEMARLDYLGFRIVREIKDKPKRYKAQGAREDGTYCMGDVILMEIKTEEYEFYQNEATKRASGAAEAAKEKFKDDAHKQGSPTFNVNRG